MPSADLSMSKKNLRSFLNGEEGKYIICGAPVCGKSTLMWTIMEELMKKSITFSVKNDDEHFIIINNRAYSTFFSYKSHDNKITLRVIDEAISEDVIDDENLKIYKFIYLPFTYVRNPTKNNERLQNVFFREHINTTLLEEMVD